MSSSLDSAIDYLSRGWMPIPLPHGSKNPNRKGWQNERWSRDELPHRFNNGQNVGLLLGEPSSGLVDVDLDCPKAIAIADELLPATEMISGRAAFPRSHRWYKCSPLTDTVKFKDPSLNNKGERAMILELRSTGGQTVVPPSVHPTGETYQWYGDLSPSVISGLELLKSVQKLAACALLARYWKCGVRQDMALALAGGLLRLNWPSRSVEKLIRLVAIAANDEEPEKRLKAVEDTQQKALSGEKATGFPTLVELMGERVVSAFQKWLDISPSINGERTRSSSTDLIKRRCLADIKPEEVDFLWHPYIPKGKLTLIEGDPGVGKSWLTCALATATAAGSGPLGWKEDTRGKVLMLSVEDGLADTIRPRLDSMGADVTHIEALEGPLVFNDAGLLRLEAEIIEVKPTLVIIDPLVAYLGAGVDLHKANETRAVMARLSIIAEKYNCAIIAVRHITKGGRDKAIYRGIGSIDFTAACRSVLLVGNDPDDPKRRAMVQIKCNLAPMGGAVGYEIREGQFFWTGESSLTAERILASAIDEGRGSSRKSAEEFLREILADGPVPSKEIEKEAKGAGISQSTLTRAKEALGIRARKEGQPGSKDQPWVWEMPGAAEGSHEGSQKENGDNLRANGSDKGIEQQDLAEDYQGSFSESLREVADNLRASDSLMECATCGSPGISHTHCDRCGEFLR
jgi:hypothetical protein